ncbi:MAG: class I SAM-dependent methyltransferase [Planctomycetota bacterium]
MNERQGPSADHSTAANDFEQMYEGRPPWDIGKPQPAFVNVAEDIQGSVLDVGCGTGENSLFFAERGHKVTGLDFVEPPLQIARQKAAERGIDVQFIQHDALQVDQLDRQFDNVLDSGLFHGLSDEDRVQYAAVIGKVLVPEGKLYLQCFSDQEPDGDGPRRISEAELREVFKSGWQIVSITPSRFVVREDTQLTFSEGGPKSWFCVVKRVSETTGV